MSGYPRPPRALPTARRVLGLAAPAALVLALLLGPASPAAAQAAFLRGDVNGDGALDLSDPLSTLGYLFLGSLRLECLDAADVDDDGEVVLTDAIHLLSYLFTGGPPPAPPFGACGEDGTPGGPGCARHPFCPPVISAVSAGALTAHSAVIRWTTNVPADSRVDYGADPGLGASVSSPGLTTRHEVLLEGLAPDTLYHYRVRSADAGGNGAASPTFTFLTRGALTVESPAAGETLRYDLALIRGQADPGLSEVTVRSGSRVLSWPAAGGRFKALAPLVPGRNDLLLETPVSSASLTLHYQPQTNPRFVRLVYLVAADGDGSFDAPPGEPNTLASAAARLQVAGRLLQTFTAEKLQERGLGRRTFDLERGADHEPLVTVVRSSLTMAQAHAMDDLALWFHFHQELASLPRREESIDLAIMGMTRFDPVSGKALAHSARGGGRLALFGSGGLHTWAPTLEEVAARWSDGRWIDTSTIFDDSSGRGTHWANYSTGLGASLHELGHCFGLPHTSNQKGVMARGFDLLNRTFMAQEPPHRSSSGLAPLLPEHETVWHRANAVWLHHHRWLALDGIAYTVNTPPAIITSPREVQIESPAGIRQVAYHVNENVFSHDEFPHPGPRTVRILRESLSTRHSAAASFRILAIDGQGNIAGTVVAVEPSEVADLSCRLDGHSAVLSWRNLGLRRDLEAIHVYRNGRLADRLRPDAASARVPVERSPLANHFRVVPTTRREEEELPGLGCSLLISLRDLSPAIETDFSAPLGTEELQVNRAARQVGGALELTPAARALAGSAFFLRKLSTGRFIAKFDLRLESPSSPPADGLAFIINTGGEADRCGDAGSALGLSRALSGDPLFPGYAIVFDTWKNGDEPGRNWVGFIDSARGGAPQAAVELPEPLAGSGTFHATVVGEEGTFTLFLSNPELGMAERSIFSHTVAGFTAGDALFGFSAATGGAFARHLIDAAAVLTPRGR